MVAAGFMIAGMYIWDSSRVGTLGNRRQAINISVTTPSVPLVVVPVQLPNGSIAFETCQQLGAKCETFESMGYVSHASHHGLPRPKVPRILSPCGTLANF